jgi:hypothetical protein
MKKIVPISLFVMMLTSCASFNPNVTSTNVNQTQVVLTNNNFKVVKHVQGTATATYVFGIGGLKKKGLVAYARKQMFETADLKGPQTIISEHTEWKVAAVIPGVWGSVSVTTSGYVVEFTK